MHQLNLVTQFAGLPVDQLLAKWRVAFAKKTRQRRTSTLLN